MTDRDTILVLIDEIGKAGLPPHTRRLLSALHRHADVLVVAKCYVRPRHNGRWLPFAHELYGFTAGDYDARLAELAEQIVATRRPNWALSLGSENAHLAVLLDRLDVPIVCYVDQVPSTQAAKDRLTEILRHAEAILVEDDTVVGRLGPARRILDARAYELLCERPQVESKALEPRPRWHRLWRLRTHSKAESAESHISETLYSVGHQASVAVKAREPLLKQDQRTIFDSRRFNAAVYRIDRPVTTEAQAIADYLRASRRVVPRDRPLTGRLLRRPAHGFNPLVYAAQASGFDELADGDPFAHFIRRNCPDGPWWHDVIEPNTGSSRSSDRRIALHAHMHYADLLPDLLNRLKANESRVSLFVTATSTESRTKIEQSVLPSGLEARIIVVPNRGRDLWPFLDLLGAGQFEGYDIVGHVHGKRSPSYSAGGSWREFLWSHLIGGESGMMDTIFDRFQSDERLGLVFAEDPHLDGWETNLPLAAEIATRAGIEQPLPNHFDYPMGNMFWVRPAALTPLISLGLTRDVMPEEPVPDDGTVLHALERLIPFFVAKAGYGYATTYVPGSTR